MLSAKPWRPELVLRLLLGLFASISLGFIIVYGLKANEKELGVEHSNMPIFLVGTLTFHGVAMVLVNVFLREHGVGWIKAFGFDTGLSGRALLLSLVMAVLVFPITGSLSRLSAKIMTLLHQKVEIQQAVQTLQSTVSNSERVYFALVAILVAPFVEEVIFRGILYPAAKQSGHRGLALWGTSLLFAASHANEMTFVPLTFLAIILTLLYETTNNLLAPFLTHAVFNAVNYYWLVTHLQQPSPL